MGKGPLPTVMAAPLAEQEEEGAQSDHHTHPAAVQ